MSMVINDPILYWLQCFNITSTSREFLRKACHSICLYFPWCDFVQDKNLSQAAKISMQ